MRPAPTSPRESPLPRQALFKVHKDSHLIHKAPSSPLLSLSPTTSSVSPSSVTTNSRHAPATRQQQYHPIIIYMHSPKVIRTSPHDFMSIVQKLTGLDKSVAGGRFTGAPSAPTAPARSANAGSVVTAQDESSSSSESCADMHAGLQPPPAPYMDPQLMPSAPLDAYFMPGIPLFAPGASELLCASRGFYRYPLPVEAAAFGPAITNMNNGGVGGSFSPSVVDTMRAFPDF